MSGDDPLGPRPMPSSFDDNEEYNKPTLQRITDRIIKEPLVPIGCLLTVAAFTNAWLAMRKGDHQRVQRMFRARVLAQGFTVLAMAAGGLYFADERHRKRELWKLEQEREAEEKRQRWIRELERRDDEDKVVRELMQKKKARKADQGKKVAAGAAAAAAAAEAQQQDPKPVASEAKQGSTSWFGSITGFFGGSSGQQPKQDAPRMDEGQLRRTDKPGTKQ